MYLSQQSSVTMAASYRDCISPAEMGGWGEWVG